MSTLAQDPPRLSIRRVYPVAPAKLWRAWTDARALSRWFGPGEADSVGRLLDAFIKNGEIA